MLKKFDLFPGSNRNSDPKPEPHSPVRTGLEAAITGFKNFRFSIFNPKPKPLARPTYKRNLTSYPDSGFDEDPSLSLQSRPDQTTLSPTKAQGTLSTILLENSKWRVVAKKAKVLGMIALQNKKILSTNYGIDESTAEKKQEVEKLRCILPTNIYIVYWNRIVSIMTCYLLFIYVFRICLLPFEKDTLFLLEIIMQGCFLADTVATFFLAYYEQDDLVTDLRTICMHYLFTYFIFDFVSSFPVNLISFLIEFEPGDENHRLLRIIPAFRIVKFMLQYLLYDGWKNFNFLAKRAPTIIRLFKILSLLLYFLHFSACIFILLARIDNTNDTWLYLNFKQDAPPLDLYIYAMYWSIQTVVTVGFGDVILNTNAERLLSIFLMYIGSAVYSFMISNLGAVAEEAATFETTLKAKMNSFNKLTKETQLPGELVQKVKKFIESNHSHNPRTTMHEQSFITELPFTLKAQIMFNINAKVVENVPFFKDKDIDFILRMAPNLKPMELIPKETVFREGEYPEDVYFLTSGILHLKAKSGAPLYVVSRGEMFGEIEVIQNILRITTAQAQNRASLFSFEKERFTELLNCYLEVKEVLVEEAQDKKKRLLDLQKKYKSNKKPGNFIVTGSQFRKSSMSADEYVNGMYEKPNNKFESLITTYVEKGIGKKYKEKYVKRMSKKNHMLQETKLDKSESNTANYGENTNREDKRRKSGFGEKSEEPDPEAQAKLEEERLINEKKKEYEKQYFQQAEKLKNELKTAIDHMRIDNDRIKDQEENYEKVARLIKAVEEKQQRITEKLEIYKSLKTESSTGGSTTETQRLGMF